ncbi:MAG: acyl-ACP--UDP-N-acetylglucosamine O-acyltransferase [Candidatus Omnitrophota bacterium]|nr:acyl-ACP--UDP-N-acetylglucosamine O-acyltransferase [Candidatus Omnitrophota bacterium]
MRIHPTAIVSKKSKVSEDTVVGPYSIIDDNVTIGSRSTLGAFCVIEGNTKIGKNCQVFTGAVLGSTPQDLKYKGDKSSLEIGDNNIIREYCTFNPGTEDGGKTLVGNNNLFMAYAHVAHDCVVGNNCIIANNGTLAGHVTVEDNVVIGGFGGIHQFVRIGKLAIVGGCSKVVQDIPPYAICDGHPARLYGLNLVGLERNKISKAAIRELKVAFRLLFNSRLTLKNALKQLQAKVNHCPEVACLMDFIKCESSRGIARSCRSKLRSQE